MPPTLILIRHAEAEHNATENWSLPDPRLTDNGIEQCNRLKERLRQHCPIATEVELIVTSPLRRTLQTTLTTFDWLIEEGVSVECDAMWQENSTEPCDTGTSLKTISVEFPELDFSNVDPTFPDKSPNTPYAFTRSANAARGQSCLSRLYNRSEKVIAVVSHSGFLRTAISKRRYANADYRVFSFRKAKSGRLSLLEDSSTAKRGGGMGRSVKGLQRIEDWDFPPENLALAAEDRFPQSSQAVNGV